MAVNDGMKCTAVNQCCAACATENNALDGSALEDKLSERPGTLIPKSG